MKAATFEGHQSPDTEFRKDGYHIFPTPTWVTVVRGFQALLAFVTMIMAGLLIHGYVAGQNVFAIVCGLLTLVAIGYALLSEKVASWHGAYNYWAILSVDLLLAIFWLSSMGANAALRATFTVSVDAQCYSNGNAVNSGYCNVYRRDLQLSKRDEIASPTGEAEMSAVAALSALEMLLFVATLAYVGHQVRLAWQGHWGGDGSIDAEQGGVHHEMKAQQQPMLNQQGIAPPGGPVYSHNHQSQQYAGYDGSQGVQQQQQQQQQAQTYEGHNAQPPPAQQYQYPPPGELNPYSAPPDQGSYQQSQYPSQQQGTPAHGASPYQTPQ